MDHITSDFYEILPLGKGLADVYLYPPGEPIRVVRGVPEEAATEENVRQFFYRWVEIGEILRKGVEE